ncbi:MAG: tetratricopeptide repeat protein [Treponema sp.]|nr:tetratricopeptide repeat protein [Candidatus Treponema caballi]
MDPITIIIIAVLGTGICFLAFFLIRSITSPKRADTILKLIKQGKNSAAIKTAKNILQKNPRDASIHYALGKAYIADGKSELALTEFKYVDQNAIFEEGISEKEFRKEFSALYTKFHQPEEALKQFLLLTKIDAKNPEWYFGAAKIFEARGKPDQALLFYQKTISLDRRNVQAYAASGLLLFHAQQFSEAKKAIDHAIQLSPETWSSYYYLGKILKESHDYPGAVEAFEKALRDPEFKQKSLIERGTCYAAGKSLDKACLEFERAIKLDPQNEKKETLYARYFFADCKEKMRDIDAALKEWHAIQAVQQNFRDVPAKIAQYSDVVTNDSMKEYLTSNSEGFVEIAKKLTTICYGLETKSTQTKKYGCILVASEPESDNWRNQRAQNVLFIYYRDTSAIQEVLVRKAFDEMKSKAYTKLVILTSSKFSGQALDFAENRPIELVEKEKLETMLLKVDL